MRTLRLVLLPLALFASALSAAPAAAEPKIAAISTPVLLRDAPQIRSADQKLKAEFEKREKDLQAEGKKLQDDFKKAQREADAMSPQQKAATEKDLFNRKSDFELKQRQFQEQAQTRNNELQRDVLEKINKAILEVATEKGLDMVLRDPAFVAPGMDITNDVLKKLGAGEPGKTGEAKKK